jgi:transcriptional regulator with XRE-family HTH domain
MSKKKVTQMDIARICGIDQGSVSRILNSDTRDSFAEETIQKVFKVARELGYLHPSLVNSNRRESPRKRLPLKADLEIRINDGSVHTRGEADVEEVSASGMVLSGFALESNTLPLTPFSILVEVTSQRLKGFKAECTVARFIEKDGITSLAVRYKAVDDESKRILKSNVIRSGG